MTTPGDTNKTGADPKVGWSPEPAVTHSELVDLLYGLDWEDVTDPADPDCWLYRGRPLTGSEQLLVRCAPESAWEDARALHRLDSERRRGDLAWYRFLLDVMHLDYEPDAGTDPGTGTDRNTNDTP